jgi:hypothetical protein
LVFPNVLTRVETEETGLLLAGITGKFGTTGKQNDSNEHLETNKRFNRHEHTPPEWIVFAELKFSPGVKTEVFLGNTLI